MKLYLSRLRFNLVRASALRLIADPYKLHQVIWQAFPAGGDLGRILFRVESNREKLRQVVLIQSLLRPDWSRLKLADRANLLSEPESKSFQPQFVVGQRLQFRLLVNPTKRLSETNGHGRGRRMALLQERDQINWLLRKGEQGGFKIPGDWLGMATAEPVPNFLVQVVPEGWVQCSKKGCEEGRFFTVRFDGLLEITNLALFEETVINGIGSAKGFGFGLLSLAIRW